MLSDEDAHHLARVLRLRDGEEVIAADGRGRWARTTWRASGDARAAHAGTGVGGDGAVQSEARAEPALTVAFAPVKGERPEWVVQKLTELGIDRIVPAAHRAQRRPLDRGARAGDGREAAPGGARGGGAVPPRLAARGLRHDGASPTWPRWAGPARSSWPS